MAYLTACSRLQSRGSCVRLWQLPRRREVEWAHAGAGGGLASWTGLSAPPWLLLPPQRPWCFHLLLRGAWVPATCPSPRKASLFILSKSNIPQMGVEGRNTHSGLIAFNESDGLPASRGLCQRSYLPVRTAGVWCVAAPGFATAGRKDLRAPATLRPGRCAARPMPSAQPTLQG